MRELFETRESCVRGSNSRTYTLSQAQTACLYIHNLRHTRTHGDAKMQYTPHTSLINKGQLAIIISIFNQSPVVLLCGLSFDNWLSPALSLSFSLSLSSLLMQLSLHLSCFMSRSCALPIYVINIWVRAPCFSTSLYPSPSRLTMSSLHPPIPPSLLSNSILPYFPSLSLSASSLHPPPSLYLWWMHPLINLDVFPLAVFFHRPSNLSLIAINHWGKQMLGTKATWGGGGMGLYMCLCVYSYQRAHVCPQMCTTGRRFNEAVSQCATQKLGTCRVLTWTLGCACWGCQEEFSCLLICRWFLYAVLYLPDPVTAHRNTSLASLFGIGNESS